MPVPTEEALRVLQNLSQQHKDALRHYGLGFPDGEIDASRFTCADCPAVTECRSAFDAYNTHGDCLEMK